MKNFFFKKPLNILSTLFVCFAFSAILTSCVGRPKSRTEDDALSYLSGTFASQYNEVFKIDVSKKTFSNGTSVSNTFVEGYAGNEMTVVFDDLDYTSGKIYFKYTKALESTSTEPESDKESWTDGSYWTNKNDSYDVKYTKPDDESNYTKTVYYYRYSTSAPDVGKYYAVAFKDLTEASASFSGAYLYNGKTSTETLEEAKSTFNSSYFAYYSECTK